MVAVIRAYSPSPPEPLPGEEQPFPQGPAPLLNRAWPRRGWAAPPFFGRTVPGLMMETTVLIERLTSTPNAIGGFQPGGWGIVYHGPAHVDIVEGRPRFGQTSTEEVLGVTNYRHYELYSPIPADPAAMPIKGDRLTFSDGYQIRVQIIMHIEMNAGLTDHWFAQTDEFE